MLVRRVLFFSILLSFTLALTACAGNVNPSPTPTIMSQTPARGYGVNYAPTLSELNEAMVYYA